MGGVYEQKQPIRRFPATTRVMKVPRREDRRRARLAAVRSHSCSVVCSSRCSCGSMLLTVLSWLCSSQLASVSGGKLPEAEVKIEVLHRPFLCHRKSKYGDMLLVHQEGYFENGTLFHSRYVRGREEVLHVFISFKGFSGTYFVCTQLFGKHNYSKRK